LDNVSATLAPSLTTRLSPVLRASPTACWRIPLSSSSAINYNARHVEWPPPPEGSWVATVHIVVYCPECQSRYQLHADLVGRRMRCTNNSCRTTFTVQEATSARPATRPRPASPTPAAKWSFLSARTTHLAARPRSGRGTRLAPRAATAGASPSSAATMGKPNPQSPIRQRSAGPRSPAWSRSRSPAAAAGVRADDAEPPRRGTWNC